MFSKCFAGILLAAPVAVDAFSSSHSQIARRTLLSAIVDDSDASRDESPFPSAIRNFVATSTVTLALLMPSSNALAQDTVHRFPVNVDAFYSSSVTLSEVIRTMDFSLPGSYESIADPVASGTEELTTSTVKSSSPKKKVEKSSASPKKSTSANRGIAMPKLEFGGGGGGGSGAPINSDAFKPKSSEEKAAVLAQRRAEREEAATTAKAEAAAREKQAAAERDASIKAARLERIAKREEEEARKAAEQSAKKEEMFKNAKVVDTSMPQY